MEMNKNLKVLKSTFLMGCFIEAMWPHILLLLCILPILMETSCFSNNYSPSNIHIMGDEIEFEIIMDDNYKINKSDTIYLALKLTNKSKEQILISRPRWWANTSIRLYNELEQPINQKIKIKTDLTKRNDFVKLDINEFVAEKFSYSINEIYGDLPEGSYIIKCIFFGLILDKHSRIVKIDKNIITHKIFHVVNQ